MTVLFCLFGKMGTTNAQWTQLSTGTTQRLNEIFFTSKDTGYVVGANGTILKTTNAGEQWISQNAGIAENLNDVYFVNGRQGWIVADKGIICSTNNGGSSWNCSTLDSASEINLNSVHVLNDKSILIGGFNTNSLGYMGKSNDGGKTWKKCNIESSIWTVEILKIAMINNEQGFALTRGMVLKTKDGGMNWKIADTASVRKGQMFTILEDIAVFPDNDTAFICGWYTPYFGSTVNNGDNWSHQTNYDYFCLDFLTTKVGYVAGFGSIRKTKDGGKTFEDVSGGPSFFFGSVFSMDFIDESTGYICGENGLIVKTTNGGNGTANDENPSNTKLTISVYPNPTNGLIQFSKEMRSLVSGMDGLVILENPSSKTIDISHLPAGIYVLTMLDEQGYAIQNVKILKSN